MCCPCRASWLLCCVCVCAASEKRVVSLCGREVLKIWILGRTTHRWQTVGSKCKYECDVNGIGVAQTTYSWHTPSRHNSLQNQQITREIANFSQINLLQQIRTKNAGCSDHLCSPLPRVRPSALPGGCCSSTLHTTERESLPCVSDAADHAQQIISSQTLLSHHDLRRTEKRETPCSISHPTASSLTSRTVQQRPSIRGTAASDSSSHRRRRWQRQIRWACASAVCSMSKVCACLRVRRSKRCV